MKTERRHELQENELAHLLTEQSSNANPYLKVGAGVAVLLGAIWLAVSYIQSRNTAQQEAGWTAYYQAAASADIEELRKVADTYPGTVAAGWALEAAGDLLLNEGVGQMFIDKEQSHKQLELARDVYDSVIKTFAGNEMLEQRAMLGLAKTLESMGDLAQATQTYEAIAKRWPQDEFSKLATGRLASVTQPQTKEWYEWLAQQKPATNAASDPSLFKDLPSLPSEPDLKMPKPGELLGPSGDGAAPPAGETTAPAASSDAGPATPPVADTPPVDAGSSPSSPAATDPSAAATPAADTTPAASPDSGSAPPANP